MKYALITGASTGIGQAIAFKLAQEGFNLFLSSQNIEALNKNQQEINILYPHIDIVLYPTDLSKVENVYALYEASKKYNIMLLVNNAGFGDFDTISNVDLIKMNTMLQLNVVALSILSSLYTKGYENVEGAQLINVSSVGGYVSVDDALTYCASKFYVSSFTEGLAQELLRLNKALKVKVLAPAAVATNFAASALDLQSFDYNKANIKYHTPQEMADFMYQLYLSDYILGIVDNRDYTFHLSDGLIKFKGAEVR